MKKLLELNKTSIDHHKYLKRLRIQFSWPIAEVIARKPKVDYFYLMLRSFIIINKNLGTLGHLKQQRHSRRPK